MGFPVNWYNQSMTISETVEVESKFEVGAGTLTPSGAAFAPLVADSPVDHELSATYYDTADLSLTRHKVTLRRRTGGDDEGWHLKLPSHAGRVELHAPLGDEVPADLVVAVAGLVRRRPLQPIARVDNNRRVVLLRTTDGTAVVEFCDDRVTTQSFIDGGSADGWREWEAELVDPTLPGAQDHLAIVATAFMDAGAVTSSSSSKLARAVGDLSEPDHTGESVVRDALMQDLRQLLDHDAGARRVTMTGVHQMRVAVRGLRSTIRSYAAELEADTSATEIDLTRILDELKVLAAVLGKVRDIQVVRERIEVLTPRYTDDVVSLQTRQRLRTELDAEERRAGRRVTAALLTHRYLDLVDSLHELAQVAGSDPSACSEGSSPAKGKQRREAEDMVLRGIDRQFARFRKASSRTERDIESFDLPLSRREELTHIVRKRAKALRRNVNALPDESPLTVAPLRDACEQLHTELGEVQDSVTARQWIRRIARRAESVGESTFGYGVLFEHERGFSEQTLAGFGNSAATVTEAYRELSKSRRVARRRKKKSGRRKSRKK